MTRFQSRNIVAGGVRTHFLEAGEGPDLVLLHSGEFGACARLSWERNIATFSRRFHVLAPDFVGFGESEKLFSFEDMWAFRVRHIAAFLEARKVDRAHFIGNSFGATMLLSVAAEEQPAWPLDRIIAIAGGGVPPDSEARRVLTGYDGSPEAMHQVLGVLFSDPDIVNDADYLARRQEEALRPGAWECAAASRFRAPWRAPSDIAPRSDLSQIRVPTLIVTGAEDKIRGPNIGSELVAQIPGAKLHVVAGAGHCPHIEKAGEFEAVATAFLSDPQVTRGTVEAPL